MIFLQSEFFFIIRIKFLFLKLIFLKGHTDIYSKQITFFEKKRFCKDHMYVFLKPYIFFST